MPLSCPKTVFCLSSVCAIITKHCIPNTILMSITMGKRCLPLHYLFNRNKQYKSQQSILFLSDKVHDNEVQYDASKKKVCKSSLWADSSKLRPVLWIHLQPQTNCKHERAS